MLLLPLTIASWWTNVVLPVNIQFDFLGPRLPKRVHLVKSKRIGLYDRRLQGHLVDVTGR